MATLTKKTATTAGGFAAGAGGTLLARERLDRSGDDALTRPSVLLGIGTGAAALTANALARRRSLSVSRDLRPVLTSYGTSALAAGLFSAAYPKGSTSAVVPSRR